MQAQLAAPMVEADLDEVLELNERSVPHVGSVDRERLASIVDESRSALVVRGPDGALAGFVIVLGEGAAYDSPNYQAFSDRYDRFLYVDRIAVDPSAHRGGVGRALYEQVFDLARAEGAPRVTCEVNVDPPNPVSMAFHASMGFVEVGRQVNYGGAITVALLSLELG
jgi:predicted GNAT superfamily acetyltransferase